VVVEAFDRSYFAAEAAAEVGAAAEAEEQLFGTRNFPENSAGVRRCGPLSDGSAADSLPLPIDTNNSSFGDSP